MKIGIDGSRAFIASRTGIEEYSYQIIKHLRDMLDSNHQVVLYVRANQEVDFELPSNWTVKKLWFPRLWTQVRLSLEMLIYAPDVLFIPAHTVPIIHPKNTVVVIHGLEYEFCPAAYSFFERIYMRLVIKNSCKWASAIISVSENTKKDLVNLYNVDESKIQVIYEGYEKNYQENNDQSLNDHGKYLLFIGRIEERKNVSNIIKAFEMLKAEQGIVHTLVLVGKPGYGYEKIKNQISKSQFQKEIQELGFVSEERKWELLKHADVFVFPTQYEGFGIPVLEAQSVGCPVVASNNSSIPEVVGDSAVLVDVQSVEDIANGIYRLISQEGIRNDFAEKGFENAERFSWGGAAKEIAAVLEHN